MEHERRRQGVRARVCTRHARATVFVRGQSDARRVEIRDFFIGTVPVTQALWIHVGGPLVNPSVHQGANLPLENVSWDEITRDGGFLSRINGSRNPRVDRAQVG